MPIHNKLTPLYLDTLSKVLLLILIYDCLEWYDCLDTTKSCFCTSSIFVQRVYFPFVSWSLLLVDREALSNSIRAKNCTIYLWHLLWIPPVFHWRLSRTLAMLSGNSRCWSLAQRTNQPRDRSNHTCINMSLPHG